MSKGVSSLPIKVQTGESVEMLNWEFSEMQMLAHRVRMMERFRRILFGGATGGGKTALLVRDLFLAATVHYPGDQFLMMRYDLALLREQAWNLFVALIPQALIKRHTLSPRPILELAPPYNSKIFGTDGKSVGKWWGQEFRGGYIDEGHEIASIIYQLLETRFRAARKVGQANTSAYHYLFITANPAPGYLHDRFIKNCPKDYIFIPSKLDDNPFLVDAENYKSRLREELTEEQFRRMAEGDWGAFEGVVYHEWNPGVHVEDFELDESKPYTIIQAADWGYTNYAVILFMAKDEMGDVWVFDEIAVKRTKPDTLAEMYHERCARYGLGEDQRMVPIDPSVRKKEREGGSAWADLVQAGMPLVLANNTRQGIMTIKKMLERRHHQFLQLDKAEEFGVGLDLYPALHVHPRCQLLIDEFPNYRWEQQTSFKMVSQNKPEVPQKKDDHALDALRYGINYLTIGGVREPVHNWNTATPYVEATLEAELRRGLSEYGMVVEETVPYGGRVYG